MRAPTAQRPRSSGINQSEALALLDGVADNLLRLLPESETSFDIDTVARAAIRTQIGDRAAEGQQRIAAQLRAGLELINAVNTSALSPALRISFEVVRSEYTTSLKGFALLRRHHGWRLARHPYAVIQNVGAYLDVPRFWTAIIELRMPLTPGRIWRGCSSL